MSYARAMKLIEEHRNNYYDQEAALQSNAITRNLNAPKTALGLGLLSGMSRATLAGGMGAPDDSLMAALGPAAGYAVAGTLPLRMMTQRRAQNKAQLELRAQEAALKQNPLGLNAADMYAGAGNVGSKISRGAMNSFMATSAAGALTGNAALSSIAPYLYMGSSLTGGPVRALSAMGGIGAMAANANNTGFLGASADAVSNATNPISASLATLPGMLGMGASKGVAGLGYMANQAGMSGIGSGLSTASGAMAKGAGAATEFGLENTMMGMLGGGLTMALLRPVMSKITNSIKDKASGQQLLKSEKGLRPRIDSSSQLQERYSKVKFLKTQVRMAYMSGGVTADTYFMSSILFAIEEHVSLLNYQVEASQSKNADETYSAGAGQNRMQGHFGETGDSTGDLSQKFGQHFKAAYSSQAGDTWSQFKEGTVSELVTLGKKLEVAGNFLDIGSYIKGGEDSPFAKYQKMVDEDKFADTIDKVSEITGIPTGFLTALETSPTTLANMGETSPDKAVMLLGGLLKVQQFAAFKLQDIAKALGVTEEDSFMNKISAFMDDVENDRNGGKKKGLLRSGVEALSGTPYGALIGGAAGLALGPMGSLIGAGIGASLTPAANIGAYMTDKFRGWTGAEKTYKGALDNKDGMDSFGSSADASMLVLEREAKEQTEAEKRHLMYDAVVDMHYLMSTDYEGIYTKPARDKTFLDYLEEHKRQTELLEQLEENTDSLEEIAGAGLLGGIMGGLLGKGKLLRGGLFLTGLLSMFTGAGEEGMKAFGMEDANAERMSSMINGAMIGSVFGLKGAAAGALAGWVMEYTSQIVDEWLNPKEKPQANAMAKTLAYAVEGALLGAALGGPWGAAAGAIGGLIMGTGQALWQPDLTKEEKLSNVTNRNSEAKLRGVMRERQDKVDKFKDNHGENFGWVMDEFGTEWSYNEKKKRLEFKDVNGEMWDVEGNKKISSITPINAEAGKHVPKQQTNLPGSINKSNGVTPAQEKIRRDFQSQYDTIGSQGGNSQQEVDTPQEMALYLSALNAGQNEFAQLSTGQQNSMIQLLSQMIGTFSEGTAALNNTLHSIENNLKKASTTRVPL